MMNDGRKATCNIAVRSLHFLLVVNIVDLLIVYLTLGAPFAVYKFLQDSELDVSRRLLSAFLTLAFWIPAALRVGYRHLSNAYSEHDFVSRDVLDASNGQFVDLTDKIRGKLRKADGLSVMSESREVLERYVGLASVSETWAPDEVDTKSELMRAAGREDDPIAVACLMRRNQRGVDRHHKKARRDFLALFENLAVVDPEAAHDAVGLASQLARALDDKKALDGLHAIAEQIKDEVCDPNEHRSVLSNISSGVPPLAMKTAHSNND